MNLTIDTFPENRKNIRKDDTEKVLKIQNTEFIFDEVF